jgi:hypothetical protein
MMQLLDCQLPIHSYVPIKMNVSIGLTGPVRGT